MVGQPVADGIEQRFQLQHMMQRLVCHHRIPAFALNAGVEIVGEEAKMPGHARGSGDLLAPAQGFAADIHASELELDHAFLTQASGYFDLGCAVAAADRCDGKRPSIDRQRCQLACEEVLDIVIAK